MERHALLMCVTASFASFVALPGDYDTLSASLIEYDTRILVLVRTRVNKTSMIEEHVRQPPRRARGLVRAHTVTATRQNVRRLKSHFADFRSWPSWRVWRAARNASSVNGGRLPYSLGTVASG